MLIKTRTSMLIAGVVGVMACVLLVASASAAGPLTPLPNHPALKKPHRHAKRGSGPAVRPRPRRARVASVVATVGGSGSGNYSWYQFRGCTQWTYDSGYYWSACRFDWFFGQESAYSTVDWYYLNPTTRVQSLYGTYRCETQSRGGYCRWV